MGFSLSSAGEIGGVRWWLAPGVALESARPLIESALLALDEGARPARDGRRKALYHLALGAPPGLLVKVKRYGDGTGALFRRLRPSVARHELLVAASLAARGVATPVPLAAGEERRRGRLQRCYLLAPILEGATDLRRAWGDPDLTPARRRACAAALGELARRLHDVGLVQDDFAPNNFLVRGDPPELLPIDFERARLRRRVPAAERRRMLAKLERHVSGASAATRMRLLAGYAGDAKARDWWRAVQAESVRLAARDLQRMRRTSTADGRRYCTHEARGWSGWARRDAQRLSEVDAELGGAPPADGLWRWSRRGLSGAEARTLWAAAQVLWLRGGLGPAPVALLRRAGETRLWLAREAGARRLPERPHCAASRRAAVALLERLLGLGDLDPALDAAGLAVADAPGGRCRAWLVDPSMFRPGRSARGAGRARIRAIVGGA